MALRRARSGSAGEEETDHLGWEPIAVDRQPSPDSHQTTLPFHSMSSPVARSEVFADRSLFGHPRGLGLLFLTEMWERFSYYGMPPLLVPYLVNSQHWTVARAATLYGNYTMLVFLTPLIGGYLADRLLGTRRSL